MLPLPHGGPAAGVPRFRGHLRAFERRGPGGEKCLGPDRRIHRSFVGRRSSSFIFRARAGALPPHPRTGINEVTRCGVAPPHVHEPPRSCGRLVREPEATGLRWVVAQALPHLLPAGMQPTIAGARVWLGRRKLATAEKSLCARGGPESLPARASPASSHAAHISLNVQAWCGRAHRMWPSSQSKMRVSRSDRAIGSQ